MDQKIRDILLNSKTIAVVGLSDKPERASYRVAKYLQDQGYRIIPVNPRIESVLGEKSYGNLMDVPEGIDVVDVFRRPEETVEIARQAVEAGAGCLWLQSGIANEEAKRIAEEGGLQVVMDRCMMQEHMVLDNS